MARESLGCAVPGRPGTESALKYSQLECHILNVPGARSVLDSHPLCVWGYRECQMSPLVRTSSRSCGIGEEQWVSVRRLSLRRLEARGASPLMTVSLRCHDRSARPLRDAPYSRDSATSGSPAKRGSGTPRCLISKAANSEPACVSSLSVLTDRPPRAVVM